MKQVIIVWNRAKISYEPDTMVAICSSLDNARTIVQNEKKSRQDEKYIFEYVTLDTVMPY